MRWGIVGFGWVARDFMAPGIAAAGGRVVAVCDHDRVARQTAIRMGAAAYENLAELLAENLDAIYVATPNHRHRATVEACLEARVPVLCEKPIAASLADAEAMARAARRSGVLLGIAFDQRHHPAHLAIQRAIAAGVIGTPTAVRIVYACWLDRDWSAGPKPTDNWRIDPARAGGGAVVDLAPHGLDLVDMLLGEPIVALSCLLQRRVQDYDVEDGGMLVGRTAHGVLLGLHVAYNVPDALPRRRIEICGTRGQIIATDTMGQDAGGTIEVIDAEPGCRRPLAFDATTSPFEAQARAFAAAVRGKPHDYDVERDVAALALLLSANAPLATASQRSLETQS